MPHWYTSNLGDAMLAGDSLDAITALFESRYGTGDIPADKAVYVRHESEGRLHCDLRVYFSPATAGVAKAMGARPCARPSPVGLDLLAGPEASRAVLFPDRGG